VEQISKDSPAETLSQELGVNLVVKGRIKEENKQIYVTVELENVKLSKPLWKQEFYSDGQHFSANPSTEVAILEDNIWAALSSAIALPSGERTQPRTPAYIPKPGAHESYLRATLRRWRLQTIWRTLRAPLTCTQGLWRKTHITRSLMPALLTLAS
jgi:hypothetical protein